MKPTPRTLRITSGLAGSRSSFRRRRMTQLSIARSNASASRWATVSQQPVAREGSVRVLDEQAQQLEFAGTQSVRRGAVGKRERPALQVQHRGTDPHLRQPWRRRRGSGRAAQQRLHSRDEFPRFEQLGDAVVRARAPGPQPGRSCLRRR